MRPPEPPPLPAAELADLEAQHAPYVAPVNGETYCAACADCFPTNTPWPCETARLVADVRRLRAIVDAHGPFPCTQMIHRQTSPWVWSCTTCGLPIGDVAAAIHRRHGHTVVPRDPATPY